LPASLEELILRACGIDIYTVMDGFERRRQGRLEKLKKMALFFQMDFTLEEISTDEEGVRCESEGKTLGFP